MQSQGLAHILSEKNVNNSTTGQTHLHFNDGLLLLKTVLWTVHIFFFCFFKSESLWIPRITSVDYCLRSERSTWRQSTDWTRPYRSTFHSLADCHVGGCRSPVCSGRSFLLLRFPAGATDGRRDGAQRRGAEGVARMGFRQVLVSAGVWEGATLHTQGVTQGSLLVLPSLLQLQRWQNGKPI